MSLKQGVREGCLWDCVWGDVAGGSQGRAFGRDWSEFAEQGVVGAVSNPMLRAQESSRSVTIRSVCILLEPVSLSTQVFKGELRSSEVGIMA